MADGLNRLVSVLRDLASLGEADALEHIRGRYGSVEDLTLEWGDEHYVVTLNMAGELESALEDALRAVDARIWQLSTGGADYREALWEDEATLSAPEWREVQVLARRALDALPG